MMVHMLKWKSVSDSVMELLWQWMIDCIIAVTGDQMNAAKNKKLETFLGSSSAAEVTQYRNDRQ